jgi:hypothetical protein
MMSLKSFAISILFILPIKLWASNITINSQPAGAEVLVETAEGGKKTKIGTTPIVIPQSQLDSITQGLAYKIEIVKSGFETYRMLAAVTGVEEINLNAILEPSIEVKLGPSTDVLISGLFEAQRLTRAKDFSGALAKLNILEKNYSTVSSIFELKGSVNYLKKDFKTALAEYRKAFTLNPQNDVAQRMKDYLESKLAPGKGDNQ